MNVNVKRKGGQVVRWSEHEDELLCEPEREGERAESGPRVLNERDQKLLCELSGRFRVLLVYINRDALSGSREEGLSGDEGQSASGLGGTRNRRHRRGRDRRLGDRRERVCICRELYLRWLAVVLNVDEELLAVPVRPERVRPVDSGGQLCLNRYR